MASPSERQGGGRRARIVALLEHYTDVVEGLRERLGEGEHMPLMCRAWRVPSQGYPELDHQLGLMRSTAPTLYWHLSQTYFHATHRRVLCCPRCRAVLPAWSSTSFHRHGHDTVAVVPRVVRITSPNVQVRSVEDAVDWLERHWRGEVFVPDELLASVV